MRPPTWVRAALSHPCFTGISRQHLGDLIAELADPWTAQHEAALAKRRAHGRRRAAGAGPHHRLAFCDRVLATLVVLRFQLPHQTLAVLYGVDRSTVTRAIHEVRPLLAARGFAVPGQPGVRLRMLADVVAYAEACGVELRIDATETQVRRPRAHRMGRRAFVSGKRKQTPSRLSPAATSTAGPCGAAQDGWGGCTTRPRSRPRALVLLAQHPDVKVHVDEGYRGLATAFPGQVCAPPGKPPRDAPAEQVAAWKQARTQQSSRRIGMEHAIAEHKQWRSLQRWLGRRAYYGEAYLAVAGLVSDRAARR